LTLPASLFKKAISSMPEIALKKNKIIFKKVVDTFF